MTFGMAQTVARIRDRILASLKEAEAMGSLREGRPVSEEQREAQRVWLKRALHHQASMTEKIDDAGYVFMNYTGQDIYMTLHDEDNAAPHDSSKERSDYMINDQEWLLRANET